MPLLKNYSLDFTTGYTLQRFTIADADVKPTSDIQTSITKRNITDLADVSYVYVANVVWQQQGSFDVLVAAISPDPLSPAPEMPNETVQLVYSIR